MALKLNSLSNAVMREGTFMDSTRDNIIKVCYYINSNISWHGAGGEGGRIKPFPGELWAGLSLPRGAQSGQRGRWGNTRPGQPRWFSRGEQ